MTAPALLVSRGAGSDCTKGKQKLGIRRRAPSPAHVTLGSTAPPRAPDRSLLRQRVTRAGLASAACPACACPEGSGRAHARRAAAPPWARLPTLPPSHPPPAGAARPGESVLGFPPSPGALGPPLRSPPSSRLAGATRCRRRRWRSRRGPPRRRRRQDGGLPAVALRAVRVLPGLRVDERRGRAAAQVQGDRQMPVAGEDLREAAGEDPAAGCGRERQVHLPEADADHPRPGLRPARARGVPPHHLQQCDQRCGDAAGLGDPWGAGPGTALTRQPRVCGDWTGPNRSGERAGGRASGTVLCAAVPWSSDPDVPLSLVLPQCGSRSAPHPAAGLAPSEREVRRAG